MALTTTERSDIIKLVVGMFNAAPGSTYLSQFTVAYEANGRSLSNLAKDLAKTGAFLSINPVFQTGSEFATSFLTPLGLQANTEAVAFIVARFNAGESKGQIALEALTALNASTAPAFANAKAILNNKTAVAENYSVAQNGSATALAALQSVVATVTADAASVTAAIAVNAGVAAAGQTFSLTQGLDTITGTAGNDTINANAFNNVTGADVTTLNSVDTINGGAGTDTLNLEIKTDATPTDFNKTIQGTISNVEIININQTAVATATDIDASKFGTAAQQIWQIGAAGNVTKLASTTTAGFRDIAAGTLSVTAADAAASATVALDGVDDASTLDVIGSGTGTLSSVTVAGAVVDSSTDGVDAIVLTVTVGKDVQTLTVNTAVAVNLNVTDGAGTKVVTAVDASASNGAIKYDANTTVATIATGSGKDDVTVNTVTSKTVGAVISATVTTNAGDDTVTVSVTGDGNTTVDTGAGDDTVNITTRSDGVLTVNLGDGADTFTSSAAIAATDKIDAGAGSDTLLLSLVGSANVVAFSNFDVYDVKDMTANLDLDILNVKNTVTEIVGSGALGAHVTLQNVGAGVNFRATKDMDTTNVLTLTQKTAGALTVTLDADLVKDVAGDDVAAVSVAAAAATSLTAVFDTAYDGAAGAGVAGTETAATDNVSTIALATQAATSVSVVSGGANAKNVLNVTEGAGTDALATVTVTGAQALTLSATGASKLATVDASAATGGLTFSLADLKDVGTVKLGSGTDVITVTDASTGATGFESIQGFEKTAAVSVSIVAGDATAKADAIKAADKIALGAGTFTVADTIAVTGGAVADKGVLTFTGAGPATLTDAIAIAALAADASGEALVFEYVGNSYAFVQGTTDIVVQLAGIVGVTNFAEDGTSNNFFIV